MDVEQIKQALRDKEGVYLDDVTPEVLDEAGCERFVAPIPKDANQKLQHYGEALADMCRDLRTKDGMKDDDLLMELRSISSALSYLLNSSSFADGVYYSYDRKNIDIKLRRR